MKEQIDDAIKKAILNVNGTLTVLKQQNRINH